MKKMIIVSVVLTVVLLVLTLFGQEFTYVGAGKCKICHRTEKQGKQYPIWEASKHSQSFQALTTDQAKEIAQGAGVESPAEDGTCLQCHGPLHEKEAELKEEGVTCEVCHGPGSAYKKLSIMKSREESVKNGLIVYDSAQRIKEQCLTCHQDAHQKPFDFDGAWDKIKHPRPEKE